MGTKKRKQQRSTPARPRKWPAKFEKQAGAILRDAFVRLDAFGKQAAAALRVAFDEAEAFALEAEELTLEDVRRLRKAVIKIDGAAEMRDYLIDAVDESPELRDYLIDAGVLRLGQELDDLSEPERSRVLKQLFRMARWGAAHLRTARARRGQLQVSANVVLAAFDRIRPRCKDDAEAYRLVAKDRLRDRDGNPVHVSPSTVRNRVKERERRRRKPT